MVLKKISLALCMVFFVAPCLFAEDTDVFNLGEIVVSGDEGVRISSTSQISSYDIETKDAQTVDEALDFVPGVRLTVGQKNEPYIMIRGFNQDDVLVLLDGIPISSPNYGYVDLNQVPVESIAKIKVIKGAVSPLYGANAIGGVVNIISKSPKEKPFLEVSNSFGENRTRYQVLNYGAKSDGVSLWLSGSRRVSDGFELSGDFKESRNEDGGLRDNSQYEENALSLKLGLEKFDRHNPTVLFNYIDNEKGIPAHISSSRPRYWKFTEWKRWMVALADEVFAKLRDT
ncbi:MAG: TonB-dependent receptor plug domain-containing protein [Candidatus Omnitrophota bacterium]